ncbi:homeobox protein NANOG [Oncorhynchus nerka]|uniref:homeobox protein NANOG n=1 Tax=Oncorhynchus nerka TaxID=8023 RepID=UPI001130579F|nr:homeobox protein Hox-A3-like [Oncorhynchus nerka]
MADLKSPVSYNPSYHAFSYCLMYHQTGPEQNHPNISGWAEAVPNSGVSGGYHQQAPHQSPHRNPEQNIGNGNSHHPGPVMYLGDLQNHTPSGCLFIPHNRTPFDQPPKEIEQPDSWTSEKIYPQTNPATWVKRGLEEEMESGRPNGSELVSSSYPENTSVQILGSEYNAPPSLPLPLPEKADKDIPKQKARTAFSTRQMDALTHRFNMQRYLSPAEMKALAGLTGLTYKQVKTWLQNRRMKLKRHQKDNGGYPNPGYPNMPPRPQFQGKAQTQILDHHSNTQQFQEAMFMKSPQQNLPYYTGGYPQPSPARPLGNWPLPPAMPH